MSPGDRSGRIFEILGVIAICYSHHMRSITEIKSYVYLSIYTTKHPSACAEVWTDTWPSTVPIRILTVPGGRSLGYFWSFRSVL